MNTREQQIRQLLHLSKTGYAGVMPDGSIVDRRKHPNAIAMDKNTMLGVPEPKRVSSINLTTAHNQ